MSKLRLSKLQKWILTNCDGEKDASLRRPLKKTDIMRFFKNNYFIGNQEFVIKSNFKAFMQSEEYNKASATISRTIKNMKDKGYVKLIGKIEVPDMNSAIDLAMRYKTKEELNQALKAMSPMEVAELAGGLQKEKTKIIMAELKDTDKATVKGVLLTDKRISISSRELRRCIQFKIKWPELVMHDQLDLNPFNKE